MKFTVKKGTFARKIVKILLATLFCLLTSATFPTFSFGSTKEKVRSEMGAPDRISSYTSLNEETWSYGLSTITFKNGVVHEWSDSSRNLKVSVGKAVDSALPFSVGSSKESVIRAMGTPQRVSKIDIINEETWSYGLSTITFKNGVVHEWSDSSGNLKLARRSNNANQNPIKIGDDAQKVISLLGSPSSLRKYEILAEEYWEYKGFSISFQRHKVSGYSGNIESNARLSRLKVFKGVEESLPVRELAKAPIEISARHLIIGSKEHNYSWRTYKDQALTKPSSNFVLTDAKGSRLPHVAENGSRFGEISVLTGRPKTVYVSGYRRKDGTYVRSHFRSRPIRK